MIKIDDEAFMNCANLQRIHCNNVSSIGENSFYNCEQLSDVQGINHITVLKKSAFANCKNMSHIDIGTDVKEIGERAFVNCSNLTSIDRLQSTNLNTALNKVGEYAFANSGLKSANLILNSSIADTYWGDHCFENCKDLQTVNFKKSMYQSSYMFKGCTSLSKVTFPDNQPCNYVGKYVFDGCTSLNSITFTKSQYSFLKGYFNNCANLKSVNFSSYDDCDFNCVQKYAFANCKSLETLEFPASLISLNELEDACLSGCSNINTIHFHGINFEHDKIPDIIYETGLFRARPSQPCNIILADGTTISYSYDSSKEIPYVEKYEYPSDKETKNYFKIASDFGYKSGEEKSVWYYNAKEIKEYADVHHIPVLIIHSYETCTPCQLYLKNIHMNSEFQDWAKKQNFLLCRLESEKQKDFDEELRYCMEDLRDNALNYDETNTGNVQSFNAFGDTTGQNKLISGWYGKSYMPPAMTFYFKKSDGTIAANHIYSFHTWFNNLYKYDKVTPENTIQMIKSLCLYHFDDNNITGARYVVDAGKTFNRIDYDIEYSNPYLKADDLICIDTWDKLGDEKTSSAVVSAMKTILSNIKDGTSSKYPEYIGDCLYEDIDWIARTWEGEPMDILYYGTPEEKNIELNKFYIQIGSKYYKFQIKPNDYKTVNTPRGSNVKIYKYYFTEVEYKKPVSKGKKYAVLASYSSDTVDDTMRGSEISNIETMIADQFDEINKLKTNSTAANVINAIKTYLKSENNCEFLFIYLYGHGSRTKDSSTSSGYTSQIGFYNSSKLTGTKLWSAISGATCKIFIFIHTCDAGHFFKACNPNIINESDTDISSDNIEYTSSDDVPTESTSFITDAHDFFNRIKETNLSSNIVGAPNTEPNLLLWTSNRDNEYGWSANESEKTSDPVWYNSFRKPGSGLGVSFQCNYDKLKTYKEIWDLMLRDGEECLKNQACIPGTTYYNKQKYMDGGPNPMKDVFGNFNEQNLIFS